METEERQVEAIKKLLTPQTGRKSKKTSESPKKPSPASAPATMRKEVAPQPVVEADATHDSAAHGSSTDTETEIEDSDDELTPDPNGNSSA